MAISGTPPLIRASCAAGTRRRGRKVLLALACIAGVVALATIRWPLFAGGGLALVAVAGLGISRQREEG